MSENKGFFQLTMNGRRADIHLYGNITSYPWKSGDRSAANLVDEIKQLDADEIHLHIDSLGGSVPEGWGMYNALLEHPAKIVTYADGFVASAALYPFLAGDDRIANSVSAFYLHEASTYAGGYADDLRKAADQVEFLTDVGINAFVDRTGQTKEAIAQLMKNETWLSADRALELGIATAIQKAQQTAGYTQDVRAQLVQILTAEKAPSEPENKIKKFFAFERSK